MTTYKVLKTETGFDIFDRNSETTINIKLKDEKDAKTLCKTLNRGGGFADWTPSFFASMKGMR